MGTMIVAETAPVMTTSFVLPVIAKEEKVQVHKLYEILTALKPAVSQGIEWDEFIVIL